MNFVDLTLQFSIWTHITFISVDGTLCDVTIQNQLKQRLNDSEMFVR